MLGKLTEKICKQQKGKENTSVWMVGEQLKDICKNMPEAVEIVLQDLENEDMSIVCAEKKIKAYADEFRRKNKNTGNCVCIAPNIAENIIKEFYGIGGLAKSNSQAIENSTNSTKFIDLKDFI